jgi:pyruvate dehydrogenase E2 component (dihydrolipoyllysine-residue acetyltransferase)
MLTRIVLPQLGQTMEEGVVEKWYKSEGDDVRIGELLFDLTTDKATLEVEAFVGGVLMKVIVPDGATVPVNTVVAIIGDADDELPEDLDAFIGPPPAPASRAATPAQAPSAAAAPAVAAAAPAFATPALTLPQVGGRFASPRAAKVAEELKIPVFAVTGSGPGGRIIERDVLAHAERLSAVAFTPAAEAVALAESVDLLAVAALVSGRRITEDDVRQALASGKVAAVRQSAGEVVALSAMRQTIAQRMTASKQTVPHFYLTGEVNMRASMAYLEEYNAGRESRVTLTALLIKAMGLALQEHPRVNAMFAGDSIVLNEHCNVGVAVAVDDGLFVPVIKDVEKRDLADIMQTLRDLAAGARSGRLTPEQYEGGSITLSNLGMFGVDFFQPIINPPEVCIVGAGAVKERVVVLDGEPAVEPTMLLSVAADHRVLDGVAAAEFFATVRELLEEASSLSQ